MKKTKTKDKTVRTFEYLKNAIPLTFSLEITEDKRDLRSFLVMLEEAVEDVKSAIKE